MKVGGFRENWDLAAGGLQALLRTLRILLDEDDSRSSETELVLPDFSREEILTCLLDDSAEEDMRLPVSGNWNVFSESENKAGDVNTSCSRLTTSIMLIVLASYCALLICCWWK